MCKNIVFSEINDSVLMPVIGIVNYSSTTIRHELIHATRLFCIKGYSKTKIFEENIAKNSYYRFFFYTEKEKKLSTFFIKQAKKKLKKAFGRKHGYVFIRLTPEEISDYMVLYGDIIEYFIEKSQTSLRHWIMCKKLDLL